MFKSLPLLIFATKAFKLVQIVCEKFMQIIKSGASERYPMNLLEEWKEFHAKNLFGILIPLYIEICGKLRCFA